jgi:LemA protein
MVSVTGAVVGFAVALIVVGVVVYAVMIYNGLVRLRRNVDKAWSNIDVLLKQRSSELDKLIDTAQEYMEYEEDVLQKITEARSQVQKASSPKEEAEADEAIKGALADISAVAEDYPELRSSEAFQQLMGRISTLEEQIADRREFYNESVNRYNIRIEQIPYVIVASALGYNEKELFEASPEAKQDVDIGSRFSDTGSAGAGGEA